MLTKEGREGISLVVTPGHKGKGIKVLPGWDRVNYYLNWCYIIYECPKGTPQNIA